MTTLLVYQDGADFYCDEDGCENDLSRKIWSAPFKVTDFDLTRAQWAREEFVRVMRSHNIEPIF